MSQSLVKIQLPKRQVNRLVPSRKPKHHRQKARRRHLVIGTILGTGMGFGFFNLALECPRFYLAFDYQPKPAALDIELRLRIQEAKYCEATRGENHEIEEKNFSR